MQYPTCGLRKCRIEWRRKAEREAYAARASFRASEHPDLCTRCHKKKSDVAIAAGYKRCGPCRYKLRVKERNRRADAAYQAYREKLALARAERLIANRVKEQAKIDKEAYEYVERLYPEIIRESEEI
jgi:DNA-directed RNA polymerase subunit RPC12/RpoP